MKWVKPNGTVLELNTQPENIKVAESLGWKPVEFPKVPDVPGNPDKDKIKLFKRLDGEVVEGDEEPREDVIIESDQFTEAEAEKKIEEGWFFTEDEAANAPPDERKDP